MNIAARAVLILLLPVLCLVALVAGLLQRPVTRNPHEVAALLERRADDEVDDDAWDDFLCVPSANPMLENIRRASLAWEEGENSDPEVLRVHARAIRDAYA